MGGVSNNGLSGVGGVGGPLAAGQINPNYTGPAQVPHHNDAYDHYEPQTLYGVQASQQPKYKKKPTRTPPKSGNRRDKKNHGLKKNLDSEGQEYVLGQGGRPRSMSDPNLGTLDEEYVPPTRPEGWVGAYSPDSRKLRVERFLAKRQHRVWTKKVKYDVRKNFADSRMRVKGRFVKKEEEVLMRELMSLT